MKSSYLSETELREKDHFNKMANFYDTNYKYNTRFTAYKINKKVSELVSVIKKEFGNKNIKILDLGCGTGEYTKKIAERLPGSKIVGLDISDKMIDVAKKKCQKYKNISLYTGNAYSTKFKNNSYDVICGFYFLHHVSLNKIRDEIYRLLKPGGTVFFYEPNILNPCVYLIKSSRVLKKMVGDTPEEWGINPFTVSKRLKYFRPISITTTEFIVPIQFFPFTLMSVLDKFTMLFSNIPVIKMLGGSVRIHLKKPENRTNDASV